ncbi:MAG: hypothetical protein ACRDE9_01710, partial [Candidatus Limnocylindria bacterium]
AAALSPLLWVAGELLRDQVQRGVSAAVAGAVAAVLILCVLRQTVLLRERDRIVGEAGPRPSAKGLCMPSWRPASADSGPWSRIPPTWS